MTAADFQAEREAKVEQRRRDWDIGPEPELVTVQSEAIRRQREHMAALCGQCKKPRSSHGPTASSSDFRADRHAFADPQEEA